MSLRNKLAFACFGLVCLAAFIVGVRYLAGSQIMPYHQQAMGVSWEEMMPSAQVQTLNYMRAGGLGFLVVAVSMGFLLAVPFRRGEGWARWALAAVALTYTVGMCCFILDITNRTTAAPPLWPMVAAVAVTFTGFFLAHAEE